MCSSCRGSNLLSLINNLFHDIRRENGWILQNLLCRWCMTFFPCPYLNSDVELTDERKYHITLRHPDLLPRYQQCIPDTLILPDRVTRSSRMSNARLFSRWFDNLRGGKYVVVVVVSNPAPTESHWVITAYIARKLAKGGDVEWERT